MKGEYWEYKIELYLMQTLERTKHINGIDFNLSISKFPKEKREQENLIKEIKTVLKEHIESKPKKYRIIQL